MLGHTFHFNERESIHIENAYKYSVDEFQYLVEKLGWKIDNIWLDEKRYFGIYLFRARKNKSYKFTHLKLNPELH